MKFKALLSNLAVALAVAFLAAPDATACKPVPAQLPGDPPFTIAEMSGWTIGSAMDHAGIDNIIDNGVFCSGGASGNDPAQPLGCASLCKSGGCTAPFQQIQCNGYPPSPSPEPSPSPSPSGLMSCLPDCDAEAAKRGLPSGTLVFDQASGRCRCAVGTWDGSKCPGSPSPSPSPSATASPAACAIEPGCGRATDGSCACQSGYTQMTLLATDHAPTCAYVSNLLEEIQRSKKRGESPKLIAFLEGLANSLCPSAQAASPACTFPNPPGLRMNHPAGSSSTTGAYKCSCAATGDAFYAGDNDYEGVMCLDIQVSGTSDADCLKAKWKCMATGTLPPPKPPTSTKEYCVPDCAAKGAVYDSGTGNCKCPTGTTYDGTSCTTMDWSQHQCNDGGLGGGPVMPMVPNPAGGSPIPLTGSLANLVSPKLACCTGGWYDPAQLGSTKLDCLESPQFADFESFYSYAGGNMERDGGLTKPNRMFALDPVTGDSIPGFYNKDGKRCSYQNAGGASIQVAIDTQFKIFDAAIAARRVPTAADLAAAGVAGISISPSCFFLIRTAIEVSCPADTAATISALGGAHWSMPIASDPTLKRCAFAERIQLHMSTTDLSQASSVKRTNFHPVTSYDPLGNLTGTTIDKVNVNSTSFSRIIQLQYPGSTTCPSPAMAYNTLSGMCEIKK